MLHKLELHDRDFDLNAKDEIKISGIPELSCSTEPGASKCRSVHELRLENSVQEL